MNATTTMTTRNSPNRTRAGLWVAAFIIAMAWQPTSPAEGHEAVARPSKVEPASPAYATARASEVGSGEAGSRIGRLVAAGDHAGAVAAYEELEALRARGEEVLLSSADLYNAALAYAGIGRADRARALYEEALAKARETGEREVARRSLNNLGRMAQRAGEYDRALSLFLEALSEARHLRDSAGEARVLTSIGEVHFDRGDALRAIEHFAEALRIARETSDSQRRIIACIHIGNVRWSLGEYDGAEAIYMEAERDARWIGDAKREADARCGAGLVRKTVGRYGDALKAYLGALEQHRSVGDLRGEVIDGNNIALLYSVLGDHDGAERFGRRALEGARAMGEPKLVGMVLESLGQILLRAGRPEEALAPLTEALERNESIGYTAAVAQCRLRLGDARSVLGSTEEALQQLTEGLAAIDGLDQLDIEWRLRYGLGALFHDRGILDKALEHYGEAIRIIESIRCRLSSTSDRTRYIADKFDLYESAVEVLLDLHGGRPEAGYDARALELIEQSRMLQRLETFASIQVDFQNPARKAHYERARSLGSKARFLDRALARARESGRDARLIKELDRSRRSAEERYAKFMGELRLLDPGLADRLRIRPISARDLSARIDRDVAYIEYGLAQDNLFTFTLTSKGLDVVRLPVDRTALARDVERLRVLVERRRLAGPEEEAEFRGLASRLYDVLIAPIEKNVEGHSMLGILPEGELCGLPFQVLLRREKEGDDTYLAQRYALFYQSVLGDDPAEAPGGADPRPPLNLVVFGNPDASLLGSEREGVYLEALIPGARVLLGPEATERSAKENLGRYSVCHIASHARLDPNSPERSYILLAPGEGEDGHLTVEEIYGLSLDRSPLITLAACRTAVSVRSEGGELIGISDAFLAAGANSILATLWPVDDTAAEQVIKRFYARLRSAPAAVALRLAQLDVMALGPVQGSTGVTRDLVESPPDKGPLSAQGVEGSPAAQAEDYAHPYFWAPFVLIGDWK